MTVIDLSEEAPPDETPPVEEPIRVRKIERHEVMIFLGAAAGSLALVWLLYERLTPASGGFGFAVCWYLMFLVFVWAIAREQLDRVRARDYIARVLVWSAGLIVIVPLLLIVVYVVARGFHALRVNFFTEDERFVGPLSKASEGGGKAAIVGTLQQVGIAVLCSVPLGVLTAIFLNEVGGPLARPVRTIVDAMSAVPSIVAGLFIFAAVILTFNLTYSGFAASLALTVLMLPTVTRTTEVVLRLVPGGLREAGLALGATDWRTTRDVVIPTARSGVATAVVLGIARVIGETAPLILTAFGASTVNANPFHGPQSALPLFVYQSVQLPQAGEVQRGWTGALVLLIIVLGLFVIARMLGGRGPGHVGRFRRRQLARRGLA
jgi:phosphate transport system permease protein